MECVYELPIAHWETTQRLLGEEAERLPAWRDTLTGLNDSAMKLERKSRELELADIVVVPSAFVFDSLPAHIRRNKRCVVAPFGAPRVADAAPARPRGEQLRVLFAGAMTQRKGLADLFAAMTLLGRPDVELVVMGSPVAPMPFYRQQYADFVYEAPRPHAEVLSLMQTCDVLVLPAIVEGRALVQLEALANGLPLIVTRNAGAEDLVEEGRTGFVVPVRAPEALATRIAWFADHKPMLADMRVEARRKAAQFPWARYEAAICDAVSAAEAARC
jgi:glycosyltransferase involved in cell wall biosynthesis